MFTSENYIDDHKMNQPLTDIKIIDFGLSKIFNKRSDGSLSTVVGTCYYVAPEVLNGDYGFECDCWSLGVILYILVSGNVPFPGDDNEEVFKNIKNSPLTFKHK
jgi:calcium-dependent protein kinase